MAKTNKEQYEVLMSELATTIKNLTNSTGKLTLEQIVTKAKQITPAPTLTGNATSSDVLKDKTFYNTDANTIQTGTIETLNATTVTSNGTIQTNGKYVNGDIVVNVPAPTLDGNATADQVLSGKTFYSNSTTKKTGTMHNVGQEHRIINNTEHPKYNIAEGYHDGTGYVEINASQIVDCVAENILQGKTILQVQGALVKGITPSGKKTITSTAETDVTNFATAQVVDDNLVASNIKKGVSVLGITGTFEATLPTLNAPTISLSNSTVTITNPVTNGSFVSGYDVYKNGTLLTSITLATVDLSTLITDSGTYTITVKAKGTNFNESVASNSVTYTVSSGFEVQVSVRSDTESSIYFYDGQGTSGTSLGSVSPGSSATFSVSSGYLYVSFGFSADSYYDSGTTTGGVSFQDRDYDHFLYKVTGNGTISNIYAQPCFVEGTLITLADGTQKKVEDINYGDEVLCYDFNEGKQTTAPIEFVMKKMQSNFYYKVSLSDGTELKLVGSNGKSHRLYNVTKQSFMYPQDFEENDYTLKQDGTIATISSIEKVEEKVNFYNISSKDHINVYAENVLTSNRLNNRFEIKNNKFTDKKLMTDEEIKAYKEHMERLKK